MYKRQLLLLFVTTTAARGCRQNKSTCEVCTLPAWQSEIKWIAVLHSRKGYNSSQGLFKRLVMCFQNVWKHKHIELSSQVVKQLILLTVRNYLLVCCCPRLPLCDLSLSSCPLLHLVGNCPCSFISSQFLYLQLSCYSYYDDP